MPAVDLPPPPPADVRALEAGDLQLRLGVGSTPRNRGVGGFGLWMLNAWGAEGTALVGVVRGQKLGLALGVTGSYGQPFLLEAAANRILDPLMSQRDLTLQAQSWGLGTRAEIQRSKNPDGLWHPYFATEFGVRQLELSGAYDGDVVDGTADYRLRSWVITPAGGVDMVFRSGFLINAELGYGVGIRSKGMTDVAVDMDTAAAIDELSWAPARYAAETTADVVGADEAGLARSWSRGRSAPRGYVASIGIGWRF
ncbi:MAG: hypothetical protein H6739_12125 [Alphaproteobacteria bacterium]|nr:hypothetical protein [Alphaproteobacteria bacterium]